MQFKLPPKAVARAKDDHDYRGQHKIIALRFALNNDAAGKIGAAIAAVLSGDHGRSGPATVDGVYGPDDVTFGQSGPNLRPETRDYVLCLHLDFDLGLGEVVYNGPETALAGILDPDDPSAEMVSLKKLRGLDARVAADQRLPLSGFAAP